MLYANFVKLQLNMKAGIGALCRPFSGNNQHVLNAICSDRRQMKQNPAEFCLTRKVEMRDACVMLGSWRQH